MGNFPSFRGVEDVRSPVAPTGQIFRPDVMMPLFGFKVFTCHRSSPGIGLCLETVNLRGHCQLGTALVGF